MSYDQPTHSIIDVLDRLRNHVAQVPATLITLPDSTLEEKLPGKWSRKEMLGHLIDSAVNNLKRFTDAQFADGSYQVLSYSQDKLVIVNQYQHLPLAHLVALWRSLNEQILYVVEAMSGDTLAKPIQLGQTSESELTLAWLIDDYVAHLEHHLKTLL